MVTLPLDLEDLLAQFPGEPAPADRTEHFGRATCT